MSQEVYRQIIEKGQTVSKSKLWKLLEAYYVKFGPQAWAEHGTPSFGSSNPITAEQYAALTIAFLKDCLANLSQFPIDPTQPIYVLDLGAGSGQFSCAFLKKILPLLQQNFDGKLKIRLVLMDIVEENFKFWKNHPDFKPHFESTILDYAYYHHAFSNVPIELLNSRQTLSHDTLRNPLILICNYFFSTIPSDLFRLKNGELQQGFISTYAPHAIGEPDFEEDDPKLIKCLNFTVYYKSVMVPPYADLEQKILESLAHTLCKEDDVFFTFPVSGFQVLRYFRRLSRERLLVIMGDYGANVVEGFKRYKDNWMAHHDSLSVPVNFSAFAQFCTLQNGFSLTTTEIDTPFIVSVSNFMGPRENWKEMQFIFEECIETFNISDYAIFLEDLKNRGNSPPIPLLLELIRLGRGSALLVKAYHREILLTIPEMDSIAKEKLKNYLHKISENYYVTCFQGGEFFFTLGELLYTLEDFSSAAFNFRKGMQVMGPSPQTCKSLGACYLALGEKEAALECWNEARWLEESSSANLTDG